MTDDRSPAVRAIDELLEDNKTRLTADDGIRKAILVGIRYGLGKARVAVIAAERRASDD